MSIPESGNTSTGSGAAAQQNESADRYRVGSVSKAVRVLELIAAGPRNGSALTDLAADVGMSKSACFALLQTLLAHGLLTDTGEGQARRYLLGGTMIRLGSAARLQTSMIVIAQSVLEQLAAEVNTSVRLGVLDGAAMSIIDRVDPPSGGLRIDLGMGDRERLHCTAVGKAALAAMPDGRARELLSGKQLDPRTSHTLTSVDAVCEDLERVRDRGFAVDDEEDYDGIMCFGAAFVDHTRNVVGAISATSVKASLDAKRANEIGTAVAATAREISRRLGFEGQE